MKTKVEVMTICYLKKEDKILFINFKNKWKKVSCVPGGKAEKGESPTDCITREFKEETGLNLINPKLKGLSYWNWTDKSYGIIFVYEANDFEGELFRESEEGTLEWISVNELDNLNQFDMNKHFTKAVLEDGLFEGSFVLNSDDSVKEYKITKI